MKYWRVPLDLNEVKVPQGEPKIIIQRCKGCSFCIEYCPRDVLKMSTDFNRKGYHYPVIAEKGACVNCNLCEMICPEFAIFCIESKPRSPQAKEILSKKESK